MKWFLFYPELYYFAVGIAFLFMSMAKQSNPKRDYLAALFLAIVGVVICLVSIRQQGLLFFRGLPGGSLLPGVQGHAVHRAFFDHFRLGHMSGRFIS